MQTYEQIAIDGPSGAGKSTVARAVAKELGIIYVDTGALYRTVGLYVESQGVDPKDAEAVGALLPQIHLEMRHEHGEQCIYLNDKDVGDSIRTPQMSMYASHVSAIPAVRAFLLETQRSIAKSNHVIMDGRDIGTVIFPYAKVKIFISATCEERARRRTEELLAKGKNVTFEEVLADMQERDNNDASRAIAPTKPAEDAILLDTTGNTFEKTLGEVLAIIKKKWQ